MGLFFKDDEKKVVQENKEPSKFKFPETPNNQEQSTNVASFLGMNFGKTNPSPQVTTVSGNQPTQDQIAKAIGIYEQGLKSLKQSGYDFQDFFDALTDEDKANPSAYQMALRFASKMDKSITKDGLVQSADFYIGKIVENYNNFVVNGNGKKQEIINQKTNEAQSLNNELSMLQQQMIGLQAQISDRQNKISNIDGKYAGMLSELDAKLAANDIAKNQVVNTLEQVKQGIINNIK